MGRFNEAPMETIIFLSPSFLDVNLIAFVMRFTKTGESVDEMKASKEHLTLIHPVKIRNHVIDALFIVRYVHGVVELNVLCLEFGLEYSEGFAEFPLWSYFYTELGKVLQVLGVAYREGQETAS